MIKTGFVSLFRIYSLFIIFYETIMTSVNQFSEVEIIQQVVNGDNDAFELLIRKHNWYLYKIGRSFGYNHEDVEDLMQETFLSAYENLRKLRNKEYFKTWLNRIMLNECCRKRKRMRFRKKAEVDYALNEKISPYFSGNSSLDTSRNVVNRELKGVIT